MGDIADSMISGELCEGCGAEFGPGLGVPWRCASCVREAPLEVRMIGNTLLPARKRVKEKRQDPLPAWAVKASQEGMPFVLRYHCCYCPRHFPLQLAAVRDHLRDVHGIAVDPEPGPQ